LLAKFFLLDSSTSSGLQTRPAIVLFVGFDVISCYRRAIVVLCWPMETKVIKIDGAQINPAEIKEAAEIIDAGGLVAFPTETVYGIACRIKGDSLAKLDEIKGRTADKYYSLHIANRDDINKYVPTLKLRAQKLIQNAWPGPLTLVFELDDKDIEKQRKKLEKEVFENLYKDNSIGIRCPDNSIAAVLLQQTDNAIVAPSANVTGQAPATNAEQVLAQLAGKVDLILDGGPCKYQSSSTVAKIGKKGLEILRNGVYSQLELEVRWPREYSGNIWRKNYNARLTSLNRWVIK
jgi:L-threonylcarbamoyladenylate synthase